MSTTSSTITAAGFVGPLTGDVTGNVTGNITGNVTGNITGNVTAGHSDLAETGVITGTVSDGVVAGESLSPTYNAATAQTVTRHNYIKLNTPTLGGAGPAAVTNACVFWFPAAAGTHKALDGATTKTTPGGVDAWVKINANGTVMFVPAYTSKTA